MKATNRKPDGFEQRELLGGNYWKDPRWKEVCRLRDEGERLRKEGGDYTSKYLEANHLVFVIRGSWGVD